MRMFDLLGDWLEIRRSIGYTVTCSPLECNDAAAVEKCVLSEARPIAIEALL